MPRSLFDLTGKTALVTGGNGGVGLGYATGMARQGANLVIWGRNRDKNESAAAELRSVGSPNVFTQIVDVTSEAAVKAGFSEAVTQSGRLDCVVSNAGHATTESSFAEISTAAWNALLDVQLNGGFYVLREAARHMIGRAQTPERGGSIMICGSLSIFGGAQGIQHYGAAKGGLASMMKGIAAELGQYGVRVNMVAPGYIKTAMAADGDLDELLPHVPP